MLFIFLSKVGNVDKIFETKCSSKSYRNGSGTILDLFFACFCESVLNDVPWWQTTTQKPPTSTIIPLNQSTQL